jgi:parallel beta-helix repeat protein
MLRRFISGIIIAVLLSSSVALIVDFHVHEVNAPNGFPVHNLDTDLNYTSIQEAIDAAETLNGHTIFVEAGIYFEHLVVNKSLSVIGENKNTTVIDGNYSGNVVTITTSNVKITGFTLQKSWMGHTWPFYDGSGIYIDEASSSNNISYNLIIDNLLYGILLNASSHNIISHNIFMNNTGSGIAILSSDSNIISNNTILECFYGIAVSNSTNNTIFENTVSSNFYGIGLGRSGSNRLFSNNMTNNNLNFGVIGASRSDFNNSVSVDNMVDGKCVYYLQDFEDIVLGSQHNIGTLYLINCKNVTVKDLFLSNNGIGLLLWETRNSVIENLTAKDNVYGIQLLSSTNITICGSYITNNLDEGLFVESSFGCSISGNNIDANQDRGIQLELSSNNTIVRNKITSNNDGIVIAEGIDNFVFENSVIDNHAGVLLFSTSDNKFYHNNFIGNSLQTMFIEPVYANYWDNGIEGNYWSDYKMSDFDNDGIGDVPYEMDENNTDHHPLMGMFSEFNATSEQHVQTICNSSISEFQFNGTAISFNVSGDNGTAGFCRICIPRALMNTTYRVFVNGTEILPPPQPLPCSNSTHSYLYFNYSHSTQDVIIISELPSLLILPLFMTATLLAAIIYKRKSKV